MKKTFCILALLWVVGAASAESPAFAPDAAMGFVAMCRDLGQPRVNLANTYWKMRYFREVGEPFDVAPTLEQIARLAAEGGGFGYWPGDAPSPAATHFALALYSRADRRLPDADRCGQYLRDTLAGRLDAARRYNDLTIHWDLYHCIAGLTLLGEPVELSDEKLQLLAGQNYTQGLFLLFDAARMLGRQIPDMPRYRKRLDELATVEFLRPMESSRGSSFDDLFFGLEAMKMLGGEFRADPYVAKKLNWVAFGPWGEKSPFRARAAWCHARMSRNLGMDMPWAPEWTELLRKEPEGGQGMYVPSPDAPPDERASLAAWRLLSRRGSYQPAAAPAEEIQGKQAEEGFYEISETRELGPEFSRRDRLGKRIDDTWEALVRLAIADEKPDRPDELAAWLDATLTRSADQLSSPMTMQILQCYRLLGRAPGISPEVARGLIDRFSRDPATAIRARQMSGRQEGMARDIQRIAAWLDAVGASKAQIPLSILAYRLEAIRAAGGRYDGTDWMLQRAAALQAGDGGVCRFAGGHSDLFETIAALRIAEAAEAASRVLPGPTE